MASLGEALAASRRGAPSHRSASLCELHALEEAGRELYVTGGRGKAAMETFLAALAKVEAANADNDAAALHGGGDAQRDACRPLADAPTSTAEPASAADALPKRQRRSHEPPPSACSSSTTVPPRIGPERVSSTSAATAVGG